jgi:hypothetical protein
MERIRIWHPVGNMEAKDPTLIQFSESVVYQCATDVRKLIRGKRFGTRRLVSTDYGLLTF